MTMKNILRWIAVPIVSVLALFVVHFAVSLFIGINNAGYEFYTGEPIGFTKVILLLCREYFVGAAFVAAGVFVAPSNKTIVATVLATAQTIFCVVSIALLFMYGMNSWLQPIGAVLTIIGAIVQAYTVKENEEDK